MIRIALRILGAMLIFAGGVWFLQGINIIPGSFMTGQTRWAAYGALTVVVGLALVFGVPKRRKNA